MSRKKKTTSNVVPLAPDWKAAFQGHAMKTSFCLALTQPMLELLCATADGATWDRSLYYKQYGLARPDSIIASSGALEKRGLIERLSKREIAANFNAPFEEARLRSLYRLTPAGAALVELLKVTGIFVTADAALAKREAR